MGARVWQKLQKMHGGQFEKSQTRKQKYSNISRQNIN